MKKFLYFNDCCSGVFGVSDYSFCCVIEAENKKLALNWGFDLAKKYDQQYGLRPDKVKLSDKQLRENASVLNEPFNSEAVDFKCVYGEFPNFEVSSDR